MESKKAPISDSIIVAVAKLVDDAQSDTREPRLRLFRRP
jgi:hypothetical protein